MEVNMEYMEQTNRVQLEVYFTRVYKNEEKRCGIFVRSHSNWNESMDCEIEIENHFSNWQKKKELLHMKSQRKGWLFLL